MHTLDLLPPRDEPATARVRFTGQRNAFTRMMIRGALLQAVTLGIYRFWLATDMRRYLWANTEIDGDSLDYTGTAIELLLGFLIALAILTPIYVLFAIGSLEFGIYSQLASSAAFIALTGFGQYAFYRARRYRLSRTVYRGIRFHQDGSGWSYAARSLGWGILILLTLGLAYPFAQASLERYKMRHTLYGDLRATFAGTGTSLFVRGLPLWLAMFGPVILTALVFGLTAGWKQVLSDNVHDGIVAGSIGWIVLAAVPLYPVFQGMVWKWWLAGLRFGPISVATTLRKRQVYGAYLRYALLVILACCVAFMIAGAGGAVLFGLAGGHMNDITAQIGLGIAGIVAYVAFMLVVWVGYQVVLKLALWRTIADSVNLDGFAILATVKPQGEAGSAVGEGLADALGAGGF